MTFGGEQMDMEEMPDPLIDDYGTGAAYTPAAHAYFGCLLNIAMNQEEREELYAAFERGGYKAWASLERGKAPAELDAKKSMDVTPGGQKDNGKVPYAPTVVPKNGAGTPPLEKQVKDARDKMARDKARSPVGLFSIGAGDVFVSIWAQAGSLRKDLAKSCAATDKKLADLAVVKDEKTCAEQCQVSVAVSFTATISFQFPSWADLAKKFTAKPCESPPWGGTSTGGYDICSPDTNPIQVHAGYQYLGTM